MKNFDISEIHRRTAYPEKQLESLEFYTKLAETTIKSQGKKYARFLMKSEDAIAHITHSIIMADLKWEPNRGTTLKSWRMAQAIFAISKYLIKLNKVNTDCYNLEDFAEIPYETTPIDNLLENEQSDVVLYSLANSGLKPTEYEIIQMYLWENMTFKEIGQHYKLTRQAAQIRYNKAIQKLGELWTSTN